MIKLTVNVSLTGVLQPGPTRQKWNSSSTPEIREQFCSILGLPDLHARIETCRDYVKSWKERRKEFFVGGEQPFEEFIDDLVT